MKPRMNPRFGEVRCKKEYGCRWYNLEVFTGATWRRLMGANMRLDEHELANSQFVIDAIIAEATS